MADGRPARAAGALTTPVRAFPPVGLYVHVPFCISICPYCDFVVYAGASARGRGSRVDAFVAALEMEIGLRADAADAAFGRPEPGARRPPLGSVYLGGGTPSLLPAETVRRLLALVARRFGLTADAEVTVEVNPGAAERGDAGALAAAGVTRISIGAQALDGPTLRRLGRRHAPEDVTATVASARGAGVRSVSLDLLYDVPDQGVDEWSATLDAALALDPDHLSLYALTIDDPDAEGLTGAGGDHLPLRPGARRWRERARARQDEDRAAAMYELAVERLGRAGYRGYEISSWARPGHESRHNLAYWRRLPVEAVGPGAHAFDGLRRRWNAARLEGYLSALAPADGSAPGLPPGVSDELDAGTAAAEALILGLRLDEGVPAARFDALGRSGSLAWAREAGIVGVAGDRVALTTRGRLLSNELFGRLL